MPTKRIFVPDDLLRPAQPGEEKELRILQYTNATTSENTEAFLTQHALIYVLAGVKKIRVAQTEFQIHAGELILIPRGEYLMSEYTADPDGFRSIMLFFSKRCAQELTEQLNERVPQLLSSEAPPKEAIIKIIPNSPSLEMVFRLLEIYTQSNSPSNYELIRLKFTELTYLLLQGPYRNAISSFLLDAAWSKLPTLATVFDRYLYSAVTITELSRIAGRSLSSFKRDFMRDYNESPQAWVRRKKLERATHLLSMSDKSIDQITEAVGFVSTPHFCRLFKVQYHMTPSDYRVKVTDQLSSFAK